MIYMINIDQIFSYGGGATGAKSGLGADGAGAAGASCGISWNSLEAGPNCSSSVVLVLGV